MAKSTEQLQQEGLRALRRSSARYVIGVDEVGYGSWAGPVVVCAAVLPAGWSDPRVKDSKAYAGSSARQQRMKLTQEVLPSVVVAYEIKEHDADVIDQMGVTRARDDLVKSTVFACAQYLADAVVVMDGNVLPLGMPGTTLCFPKADALVPAVSAASVLAKAWRDELMERYDELYPHYDFASNAGYGTARHQQGLLRHGPCPIHRMSYRNIREVTAQYSRAKRKVARLFAWQPSRKETPGSTRSNKP